MFFSICIPVNNVEKYIRKCLDSIINQDENDFEVILVDDGSTDRSGCICDEYAELDSRIKVFHKKNEGLLLTRRYALKHAIGDYIITVDSDDYLKQGAIQVLKKVILEHDADLVIFRYERTIGKYKTVYSPKLFEDRQVFIENDKHKLYKKLLVDGYMNNLWNKVAKRSIIDVDQSYEKVGMVRNGEDLVQSIPLLNNASKVIYIWDVLYNYRINNQSMTSTYHKDMYTSVSILHKYKVEYAKKWNLDNEATLYEIYDKDARNIQMVINQIVTSNMKKEQKVSEIKRIKASEFYSEMCIWFINNKKTEDYSILYDIYLEDYDKVIRKITWKNILDIKRKIKKLFINIVIRS